MMQTSGDLEGQTPNRGGTLSTGLPTARGQAISDGASVCRDCDGTGWTSHATKGMTRCTGEKGIPHDNK